MTANAAEIEALALRCESATGADGELDAAVWLHLPEQEGHAWKHGGDRYKHARQIAGCSFVPAYTSSLDAAMALVPERWDWGIAYFGPRGSEAQIWPRGDIDSARKVCGSSDDTVALSLAAAALRARASEIADQPQQHGEG